MSTPVAVTLVSLLVLALILAMAAIRIVRQYEQGVLFRLGRVIGVRQPGLRVIIPVVDVLHKVSLRVVTMPIQSQGIITRDNVSVDVSAVAYYRVVDAVKSVVAIENVRAAIDQIAQTTLRKVVGQHTLDETLAETDRINMDIRQILDITTVEWGVEVTLVELKDIQLPDSMKRAMARQAEAEREKRAKIIAAEGEAMAAAALGDASDTMMQHPLALQLRNLQTLVELGVDKNTTVVFPAPLMSTIGELGSFLAKEATSADAHKPVLPVPILSSNGDPDRGRSSHSLVDPGAALFTRTMTTDQGIHAQISELVARERALRAQLQAHEIDPAEEQAQLRQIEIQLDQCWDLLRQREALRNNGGDPAAAAVRPANEVEGYLG